jgi:hypothetical protein
MSHAQAGAGCLLGSVMHQDIMSLVKQLHDCTYTISVAAAGSNDQCLLQGRQMNTYMHASLPLSRCCKQ